MNILDGAASNITWDFAPPRVTKYPAGFTDITFHANEGDLHWVLRDGMAGAYQYFVNRALPVLGEFRTLWRLDNATFTHGWTVERNEPLVPLHDIRGSSARKVQDETWQRQDGSFITKYDLATFLNVIEGEPSLWGVQGKLNAESGSEGIGSWYIHGGKVSWLFQKSKMRMIPHTFVRTT
jgi:rhamnogalacturonan endolyase